MDFPEMAQKSPKKPGPRRQGWASKPLLSHFLFNVTFGFKDFIPSDVCQTLDRTPWGGEKQKEEKKKNPVPGSQMAHNLIKDSNKTQITMVRGGTGA